MNNIIDYKSLQLCELCGGTGEIATDEDDGEGHTLRGVNSELCPKCHTKRSAEDEADYSRD